MGYAIMDSNDEIKAIEAELGRKLRQGELTEVKVMIAELGFERAADEFLNPFGDWEEELQLIMDNVIVEEADD